MKEILYIICRVVQIALDFWEIAMFLRAILSWFLSEMDNPIMRLLILITEPLIIPFRVLFQKLHWFENVPVDIPFIFSWIVVGLINSFLPAISL